MSWLKAPFHKEKRLEKLFPKVKCLGTAELRRVEVSEGRSGTNCV